MHGIVPPRFHRHFTTLTCDLCGFKKTVPPGTLVGRRPPPNVCDGFSPVDTCPTCAGHAVSERPATLIESALAGFSVLKRGRRF